jgi:hypothetical protein
VLSQFEGECLNFAGVICSVHVLISRSDCRRTFYEEFEIVPLGGRQRNSETGTLPVNPGAERQGDDVVLLVGVHPK